MDVKTIFMNHWALFYCWPRYSNMGCMIWPSDWNWINMKAQTISLVAIVIFIVRFPVLYLWFNCWFLCYKIWFIIRVAFLPFYHFTGTIFRYFVHWWMMRWTVVNGIRTSVKVAHSVTYRCLWRDKVRCAWIKYCIDGIDFKTIFLINIKFSWCYVIKTTRKSCSI